MLRTNLSLVAAGAWLALGVLVLVVATPVLVRALVWIPLATCGLGSQVLAALFQRRSFSFAEWLLFSLSLGLATLMLGAIVLYSLGLALEQKVWAGLVMGVTLAAALVARARPSAAQVPTTASRIGLTRGQWGTLGLAGLIAASALGIARMPVSPAGVPGYTSFWMLREDQAGEVRVRVGIESAELAAVSYRVTLAPGTIRERDVARLTLGPGEAWDVVLVIPPEALGPGAIEARLYRLDAPDSVYRQVRLR